MVIAFPVSAGVLSSSMSVLSTDHEPHLLAP
jgi:fatty acid desaturase